ncbi:MAG: cytochrome c [Bdellovibrionota bacterium]
MLTALIMLWGAVSSLAAEATVPFGISVRWAVDSVGEKKELRTWSVDELAQIKGSLMATVLEKSLEPLPPESRARVDLVIAKSKSGNQAWLPRSLITRYPIVLNARGELRVPWKSHPKVLNEPLPVLSFDLSEVQSLDFANYHDRFGPAFLKRRTDPTAMRGEKLFLQNCRACHEARNSANPAVNQLKLGDEPQIRTLVDERHRGVNGMPKFSRKEVRALKVYSDAIEAENPPSPPSASIAGESR